MKKESRFQSGLIEELELRFPGCLVLKTDPTCIQGIPDLLILYRDRWAALEVKRSEKEMRDPRPNQPYYVDRLNRMSFASFIYPENKEEVLNEMEQSLQ